MTKKTFVMRLCRATHGTVKRMQRFGFILALSLGITWAMHASILESQVSLTLKNTTLKDAFKEIQQQTGVSIIYSTEVLDDNTEVSLQREDLTIEEALAVLLANKNCSYRIENNQVILYPAPEKAAPKTKVLQQTQTVTGVIKDSYGEPIIGAAVAVAGTTDGTITNIDGEFILSNIPQGSKLVISYLGYKTQEVIANSSVLNIILEEDNVGLDDVVVVGFGTQKKANLTGSVANVDKTLLENRPMTSVSAGLQGLLPGVSITQGSGQPGSDNGTIRIRGVGTFNNSNPMVIVDGVESSMNHLDPNDIDNISVLKDAASAAIYGSKAANGVILITTKRGKSGKATINYSANFGWQSPTKLVELVESADYAVLYNEALRNGGKPELYTAEEIRKFRDGSDPYNYPNTDWQGLFYVGSGFQHTHNINISGGNEGVRYMTSIGYQGQEGIIRNANKDQYNLRVNIDANPTNRIETSITMAYTNTALVEPTNPYVGTTEQIFRQVKRISPMVPYKYENGEYGTIGDGNPIAWMDMNATTDKKRHNMLASGSVKYTILEGLSIKGVGSYKLYVEDSNELRKDIQYNSTKYHGPTKMYQKDTFENTAYGDILLEYKKGFGLHHLNVLAGFHSELYQKKYTEAYREGFPNNEVSDLNAGSTAGMSAKGYTRELAMLSWLGRVNYDYAGKYLFEANLRYDGTSRFAAGNRWGAFPSLSAGWRISEEEFFEPLREAVDNVKIRGSWGMLGNQSVLDKDNAEWYYPTVPTFTLGQNYPFGGGIQSGGAITTAVNPALKWESTTTWGLGLDFTLAHRINITVDYYNKQTNDILMKIETPDTYALTDFIGNVGSVVNRGVEVNLQYTERLGAVDFTFGGNFSYNKNEIKDLGGVDELPPDDTKIKRVGYPINSFYGYKTAGLYRSYEDIEKWATYKITGAAVQPGDLRYVDINGDKVIDANDRVIIGNEDPKFNFAFNVGAKFKGFDLMLFFQGAAGVNRYMNSEVVGEINGDDAHPSTFWLDRWHEGNPKAKVPRVSEGTSGPSMPGRTSDYWLQNANYLRLKNLQFGYNLPTAWTAKVGISRARIYYSGQNILTFTNFLKGWDPESPSGRGGHYPQVMVNSFGLNITF